LLLWNALTVAMSGENDSSIRGAWFANQAYEKNGPSGPRSLQHQILQEETEADLGSGSNLRNRSSEDSKRIPAKLGAKQANGNGTSEHAPSDPPGGVKEESEEEVLLPFFSYTLVFAWGGRKRSDLACQPLVQMTSVHLCACVRACR
jgi:hypothetical protein